MANSVDPDRIVLQEQSYLGSALFAYVILSETLVYKIVEHLTYLC